MLNYSLKLIIYRIPFEEFKRKKIKVG